MAAVGLLSFLPEGQECAVSWGTVRANSPKNGASVEQEKLPETLAQQHGKPERQGGVETSPEMEGPQVVDMGEGSMRILNICSY